MIVHQTVMSDIVIMKVSWGDSYGDQDTAMTVGHRIDKAIDSALNQIAGKTLRLPMLRSVCMAPVSINGNQAFMVTVIAEVPDLMRQ